jgi:hypothetical protein
MTGWSIWEWHGTVAALLSGNGVVRMRDATVVYQNTKGYRGLTVSQGKVTGWTEEGQGANLETTGTALSLGGRPYSWTAKSTGPWQYTIEGKFDH